MHRIVKNARRSCHADHSLTLVFDSLLRVAEANKIATDSHLQVYGDTGEFFGAILLA